MTQDEIIEMARQAGFHLSMWQLSLGCDANGTLDDLETFAKLAAAKEREACALICDEHSDDPVYCGDAIRARGQA